MRTIAPARTATAPPDDLPPLRAEPVGNVRPVPSSKVHVTNPTTFNDVATATYTDNSNLRKTQETWVNSHAYGIKLYVTAANKYPVTINYPAGYNCVAGATVEVCRAAAAWNPTTVSWGSDPGFTGPCAPATLLERRRLRLDSRRLMAARVERVTPKRRLPR